jgi:hypothetical protein
MDAYVAGVHPIVCRWPSTNRLVSDLAFADSYRILYPDEIIKPGFTWAPRKPLETNTLDGLVVGEQVPSEHHDRIDFVFSRGQSLSVQVVDVKTIGARLEANHLPIDDGVVEEKFSNTVVDWPSDHRAVLATFIVQ